MHTNPRRYLVRMFVFLLVVGIIATLLAAPLTAAFMGNPALNGVILGAFGIGILFVIRQTLRLMPERNWLLAVKTTGKLDAPWSIGIQTPLPPGRILSRRSDSASAMHPRQHTPT